MKKTLLALAALVLTASAFAKPIPPRCQIDSTIVICAPTADGSDEA